MSDIIQLIAKTQMQLFNPLLTAHPKVKEYMKAVSNGKNCCHQHGGKIIFLIDGVFYTVDNTLPPSHFIAHSSMATMEKQQFEMFRPHAHILGNVERYYTNMLFPGSQGKIKISGTYQIFAVSNKSMGQYFDLQAFSNFTNFQCATYSTCATEM